MLGFSSRGKITLLIREITFTLSQYVITIYQCYKQPDGQTDDILIAIPYCERYVLRAVKTTHKTQTTTTTKL